MGFPLSFALRKARPSLLFYTELPSAGQGNTNIAVQYSTVHYGRLQFSAVWWFPNRMWIYMVGLQEGQVMVDSTTQHCSIAQCWCAGVDHDKLFSCGLEY